MPNTRSWNELKRELEEKRATHPIRYRMIDAYRSHRNRFRRAPGALVFAYQRVARGWDDRAVWSLDTYMARTLGEQLVELSKIAHGYPGDHYPYEQWTADLKRHGDALFAYSEGWFDEWETVATPAQDALRWVADNLGSLWD